MQFAVYLDSLLFIYFYVLIFVFDFFREAGEKKMIHLLEKYHKDLNAIESPTSTSSALVKTDLLPEVDTTETESSINASSALVITDYCQK